MLRLAENGVQGAILKSCADYERGRVSGKREFAVDKKLGFTYASAPFESEILTLDECLEMLDAPSTDGNAPDPKLHRIEPCPPEEWIPACQQLEAAGADGIQLDFFYMGNPHRNGWTERTYRVAFARTEHCTAYSRHAEAEHQPAEGLHHAAARGGWCEVCITAGFCTLTVSPEDGWHISHKRPP